ncbi:MAG TPA: phosphate ABC transporter permease PstA [Thermodesulfobacteriota bacterium]|nr:phosphate ABC transporter permease PstA [Thermodesulfobacteriota bacterium]
MRISDLVFRILGIILVFLLMTFLFAIILDLFLDGYRRLSPDFLTSYPSRFPEKAGILSAWVGTIYVMLGAVFWSVLLGIPAGVYLEEYATKNWIANAIEINIYNLAAVPSIIYGLLALGLFVYRFDFGTSILTGGLTLALLMLPIIVVATRESIRRIPLSVREAAYSVGATKWETVRDHIIPYSIGGILTGVLIAASRAIGETAPLITIGALTFIAFLPPSPVKAEFPFFSFESFIEMIKTPFTVLPIQMFNWVSRPQKGFHENAAAAGLVLIMLTLILSSLAIYIRYRVRRSIKW